MQQHQQHLAQQSTIGTPQTTGMPISMQQQLKKLPLALNVPQMCVSSNGSSILYSQPHLTLSFCAFTCYDVDVITFLFVTDSVHVL
jgi:hypothetical protein